MSREITEIMDSEAELLVELSTRYYCSQIQKIRRRSTKLGKHVIIDINPEIEDRAGPDEVVRLLVMGGQQLYLSTFNADADITLDGSKAQKFLLTQKLK